MTHFSKFAVRGMKYLYPVMRARIRIWSIIRVPFTVNLKWDPLHIVGDSLLHKNISVAVKIVALKSVATLHFHVIFLFCDRFHWRRSFSFWCITSWSLTRIVNGIIIRSTWGSYTWYKWQLGRRGLKTLFKDLHQGEMNMNSETIYVRTTTQTNPRTDPIQFVVPILNGVWIDGYLR